MTLAGLLLRLTLALLIGVLVGPRLRAWWLGKVPTCIRCEGPLTSEEVYICDRCWLGHP